MRSQLCISAITLAWPASIDVQIDRVVQIKRTTSRSNEQLKVKRSQLLQKQFTSASFDANLIAVGISRDISLSQVHYRIVLHGLAGGPE